MIPPFKYYFFPFLNILEKKGCCRLFDIANLIATEFHLSEADKLEKTKGGSVSKHLSRVNYCASYLKRMGLVETYTTGAYQITHKGVNILNKHGKKLTLTDLRNMPEFIATQVSSTNKNAVYIKPHKRGNKMINGYVCNKANLNMNNPNIQPDIRIEINNYIKTVKE